MDSLKSCYIVHLLLRCCSLTLSWMDSDHRDGGASSRVHPLTSGFKLDYFLLLGEIIQNKISYKKYADDPNLQSTDTNDDSPLNKSVDGCFWVMEEMLTPVPSLRSGWVQTFCTHQPAVTLQTSQRSQA